MMTSFEKLVKRAKFPLVFLSMKKVRVSKTTEEYRVEGRVPDLRLKNHC